MSDTRYRVIEQKLFIDEEDLKTIMDNDVFFDIAPGPPRFPNSIWGRFAKLRAEREQSNPGNNFHRVVVPLHSSQNMTYTRKQISVKIFMAEGRTDVAYDPASPFFSGAEPTDSD